MYWRTAKAIKDNPPPPYTCMFDSQFAKVVYSQDIAFAITTRTDAAGAQGVIEIMKENINEHIIGALRGRNPENPSERGRSNGKYKQRLELNENHTSNTITSVQKDNVVVEPIVLGWSRDKKGNVVDRHPVEVANCVTAAKRDNTQNFVVVPANTKEGEIKCEFGGVVDIAYPTSTTRRGRVQEHGTVALTLTCGCEGSLARIETPYRIRKLTERECFRLMGVRDEDSDKIRAAVSKSQCYKLAGNSIVVDVMVRIFDQLLFGNKNKNQQLEIL